MIMGRGTRETMFNFHDEVLSRQCYVALSRRGEDRAKLRPPEARLRLREARGCPDKGKSMKSGKGQSVRVCTCVCGVQMYFSTVKKETPKSVSRARRKGDKFSE